MTRSRAQRASARTTFDQVLHRVQVIAHRRRDGQHVGLALDHRLHDGGVRRVRAAEIGFPAGHLEEVCDHAGTEIMQIAADAGDDDAAPAAFGGGHPQQQLRHHDLGGGAAEMFLRDADLLHLPQAADLSQRGLEDLQVQLADGLTAFGGVEHQPARRPPVAAQQRVHVLARQRRQALPGVEEAGASCSASRAARYARLRSSRPRRRPPVPASARAPRRPCRRGGGRDPRCSRRDAAAAP